MQTVIGWILGLGGLMVAAAIQWSAVTHAQEVLTHKVEETKQTSASNSKAISTIELDVRILDERQRKMDRVVIRQEESIKDLDKIAARLQAIAERIEQ